MEPVGTGVHDQFHRKEHGEDRADLRHNPKVQEEFEGSGMKSDQKVQLSKNTGHDTLSMG
jgi:hypothetical protein